jgi:hypothetical protein
VTIYLNLDSDEVYTADVAQLIADNPVPQLPTYDEWLEDFLTYPQPYFAPFWLDTWGVMLEAVCHHDRD